MSATEKRTKIAHNEPEASVEPSESVTLPMLMRALARDKPTLVALIFLLLVLVSAVGAEFVAPFDPLDQNLLMRNQPPMTPSSGNHGFPHVLGTDPLGRDVLSRIIFGARVSLTVGASSVIASGVFGVLLGLLAGYFRGLVDDIVMRVVDMMIAFPTLLLAMFILFVVGRGFINLVLVLALVRWMTYARLTRSMTLAYRESPFVEGAQVIGCSDWRIIFRHILPNLFSPILVLATLEFAAMVLSEAGLSFLGFGIQPPSPSWGLEVSAGREYLTSAWWLVTFPGFTILLTTLSLNLLATWLRAISDPVQRWRWLIETDGKGSVGSPRRGDPSDQIGHKD